MEGSSTETLTIKRTFPAPKERVFRAWTDPAELGRWWRLGDGWTTPLVEMDLRAGGKFVISNQHPSGDMLVVRGEFRVVDPPERLVYTWHIEKSSFPETIVTVEFRALGDKTEVVVTHQLLTEMGPSALAGWNAALENLGNFFGQNPSPQ